LQKLLNWQCVSRINLRLRTLFDAGYLDRRFVPVLKGSSPAIYLLGTASVAALAEDLNEDHSRLQRFRHQDKHYSDVFMRHALAVSEFAVAMQMSCNGTGHMRWLKWLNDRLLLQVCNDSVASGEHTLKPDGYGRYALGERAFNFFLELDTGSESITRLHKKIQLYQRFRTDGAFQARFGMKSFRLLIVTLSDKRARSLTSALREPDQLRIWTATLASAATAPLFAPVWRRIGQTELSSLHPSGIEQIRGSL